MNSNLPIFIAELFKLLNNDIISSAFDDSVCVR